MEKMISLKELECLLNAEWDRHMSVVKNTKIAKQCATLIMGAR